MKDYSYVFNAHPSYIEATYQRFLKDPSSVEDGWRSFFEGFEFAGKNGHTTIKEHSGADLVKEYAVVSMIHGFRKRGHLLSTTNPIRVRKDRKPFLDIGDYGLEESDKTKIFKAGLELGLENATLDDILARLNGIYCGNIGFEYAHIENKEKRIWLRQKIEGRQLDKGYGIALEKKKRILSRLNGAVVLEKFLHTKYIGQKRFSLEGGETTIAAIDAIINHGATEGVKEFIIGMAHRGRLNVLANIMGKTYEQIFSEFEGTAVPDLSFGDGDVKYHMGYSSQVKTPDNHKVYLKLVPNPSHLEAVDPVVEGFARAKVDLLYESPDQILPILIHGDAALAGQGVVYETVQMSQLPGYYTGGTIHFVINNQIGFTTDFDDARSSTYSTAAASLVQAPVFHVNGDDPEAVVYAVELAVEYRQKFNNDVFVDMVCYRRHGHNESDDPKFTQPAMYEVIHSHPNPREIYVKHLAEKGDVEQKLAKEMEKSFWANLQARLDEVKQKILPYEYQKPELEWKKLTPSKRAIDFQSSPKTGIPLKKIQHILNKLIELPESFTPLSKVNRLLKNQSKLIKSKKLDWALAELMAYASLLAEGTNIRMSGQDVKRGTFSHRHAIFSDTKTFEKYNRLNPFGADDATMRIYNSLLSEFAVLGFEYGYSMASPQSLVIWEAQFGDFSNGAQTIVDQFIAASESKWRRMSGLVMLLPHGYEGQGPEHSSARLERFLLMGAEFNITIANCTTPANFFHLIRRQIIRNFRKPLIVMSPKSLLRHPQCISDISHCKTGTAFQEILDDDQVTDKTLPQVKRTIFCSGKVYYDLLQKKVADGREDVALIRIEQLYPMAKQQMDKLFQKYDHAELFWVQEEPVNMGAWQYLLSFYNNKGFQVISRKSSASPATGFKKIHDEQQDEIIRQAFDF